MYHFILQPFLITLFFGILLIFLIRFVAKCFDKSLSYDVSILIVALMFIPGCMGIMSILDSYRYGSFEYASSDQINDERIVKWLPNGAEHIQLYKSRIGHFVKFSIDNEKLLKWITEMKNRSSIKPQADYPRENDPINFEFEESPQWWQYPENSIKDSVVMRKNGAGYSVWYSRKSDIVFLRAYYW